MRRIHLPWPEDQPVDFFDVAKAFFGGDPDVRPHYYELTFHQAMNKSPTKGTSPTDSDTIWLMIIFLDSQKGML